MMLLYLISSIIISYYPIVIKCQIRGKKTYIYFLRTFDSKVQCIWKFMQMKTNIVIFPFYLDWFFHLWSSIISKTTLNIPASGFWAIINESHFHPRDYEKQKNNFRNKFPPIIAKTCIKTFTATESTGLLVLSDVISQKILAKHKKKPLSLEWLWIALVLFCGQHSIPLTPQAVDIARVER